MLDVNENKYKAPAAARALRILELMAQNSKSMGASELSESLDITVNSAFRILCELEHMGYVYRNAMQKFELTPRLYHIGQMARPTDRFALCALPVLKELSERTQETVLFCSLTDSFEVLLEEQFVSPLALKFVSKVGCTYPAYTSAMGKAMLSHMDDKVIDSFIDQIDLTQYTKNTITETGKLRNELSEAKKRKYAVDDEESADGIYCIGVPVFDSKFEPIMAVGLSGPKTRMLVDNAVKLDMVRNVADRISDMYGAKIISKGEEK